MAYHFSHINLIGVHPDFTDTSIKTQNGQIMNSNFFLQYSVKDHKFQDLDLELIDDDDIKALFSTYIANMDEVLYVIQSSFNLILHAKLDEYATSQLYKNRMHVMADAIRHGKYEDESLDIEAKAKKKTDEQLEKEGVPSEDILTHVTKKLNELEQDEVIKISNHAVLRQSIVIIWSATESLIRDTIRTLLNNNTALANSFLESDTTKPYWNKKNITYNHLQKYDFNIKENLGDVALEINPCSSLSTMKSAFHCIFGADSTAYKMIKSQDFYLLYKLRNLIAHRNGIVDEVYKTDTGYAGGIGDKIIVLPDDFNKNYCASKNFALNLYQEFI